ncbi:27262_t:CDS:2 [Gigaspora margarita]|uniref:27262_t:CDS:1 n=1 Tax=Gigaspora margarita TaxID=4874 RepID=A0ABN7W7Y7_GIGMA|nr:27262_t:CDS:2 [Gigaspora margarita]
MAILMNVDWESFIMLLDIFNNINTSSLSDNEDNNIIINRNLDPLLSNYYNSVVINTNLLPPLAKYNNNYLDPFNNWQSVDSIIRCKSFCCLLSSNYEPQKIIDQNSHHIWGTIKMNCEWHCNFTYPKTAYQIRCTILKDTHNHKINLAQISDVIADIEQRESLIPEDLYINTINDNFIEDVVDELQTILKTILSSNDISNINEM